MDGKLTDCISVLTVIINKSRQFPSMAPSRVVYPPTDELNVSVDSSGLVNNITYGVFQNTYYLSRDENYTFSVVATHNDTGSSLPETIALTSM